MVSFAKLKIYKAKAFLCHVRAWDREKREILFFESKI